MNATMTEVGGVSDALRIGEVVARTGLSADALRYYERAGLLSPHRDSGGRRRYDSDCLHLLDVLLCLRRTGMPVRDVREFADLVRTGAGTVPQRVALLADHRQVVVAHIDSLRRDLARIEDKIASYTG